jgi:autotransporter translocation and assembly factor TamB
VRLALFLVVASLGIRALVSEPTLTFALDELAARLHEELGLTLVVAHIEADAESARVQMGPVILKGVDGELLFSAKHVRAELAPLKFFERRLRLEHLVIESPRVNLRVVDGKIAGVHPTSDAPSSDDPLLRVDVADFQLHDGAVDVVVTDEQQRLVRSHLSGIEMRLRERGREEHRLKFTVKQAEVARLLHDGSEDTVTVDAFGGRLAVKGDGLLAPERITVSGVTLVAGDAELSVAGEVILGPAGLLPALEADVSARAELASVLAHLQLAMPVAGAATLAAHVSARPGGEGLLAVGQLETRDVHVDNLHLGSLRARVRADPSIVDITAASWDWADTTIKGSATVHLDDELHTVVKANADTFSIHQLMYGMGVDGAWGDARIDGAIEVSGTLHPLLLEGTGTGIFTDVVAASMDVRQAPAARIVLRTVAPIMAPEVSVRVDTEGMRFAGTVDDGFTRASGFFQVFYDKNRGLLIDADSERADFASVGGRIGRLDFGGKGSGHLHVEGPQSGPVLTAELALDGLSLEGFAFGDASGRVHLFRDDLRFEDVTATKSGRTRYGGLVALSFADDVPRAPAEPADATIESPHLTLDLAFAGQAEDLRAIVPLEYVDGVLGFLREDLDLVGPVQGRVNARGAVGDSTFDHVELEGNIDLQEGTALLDQHVSGTGTFHMTVDRFHVDTLDLTLGAPLPRTAAEARGTAHATAHVGRSNGDLAGLFEVRGLALADVDELKDTAKPFQGSVDVDGRLLGVARDPAIQGSAIVRRAAYGSVPIGDAELTVDHKSRLLTLSGTALSGRGDALVHVATRSPFEYDGAVGVSAGPLAPFLPKDALPASVSATVGGDVDVRGALKTFRDSRGTLLLKTLAVKASGLDLTSTADASAHFHGSRLTFDSLDLATKESAAGDVRVGLRGVLADDEVDLQLSGRGDLKLLPRVWKKAESAGGNFTVDVAVTGDLDHASMSGQGFVAGGKLALDGPFPPLDELDAQIAFRGPNIVIERATAKASGAPVQAQGAVTMDGVDPVAYDLELRYQRMKLKAPAGIESLSSGRLALKGDAALPTLTGEVRVHSARYAADINWERLLPDLRRRSGALQSLDTDDEDVRFDVHLIADRGLVVENNVLDLEAKGDLFLTGTEERPGLKGGVQLIRGNATFRGNRYRLARGTVDFVDTYRVMPVLDIETEARVQDYDVTAHLSGPAQAPVIDLSSRPDLSEIDIVSLLTFGFTQFEVRDAGGSAGAAGLEVVSAYTGLDKELRRVLPEAVRKSSALSLDELRLTSQFSVRAGASVPAVALGMEVNPGLWGVDGSRLRLQSTLFDTTGAGTQQRVEWEKRFDNNVRLRVVWDSEDDGTCPSCTNQWGDFGGDLWYRWEF